MRHNVAGRLFGRTANQRKALLRGLVGSLFEHERIETTLAKAKETRRIAEKLVTLGKRGDLHAKRLVLSRLPNRALVIKLFDSIAPRFSDRNGGYLRIVQSRRRERDQAQMAVLEFVDYEDLREKKQDAKKQDAKKQDAKKQDAKKQDAKKQDAKKQDAKKQETKKQETKKQETKKSDAKKQDAKKQDAKKQDAKKQDAKKQDAKKPKKEDKEKK
jgi:large subunit ribosomal protein L17